MAAGWTGSGINRFSGHLGTPLVGTEEGREERKEGRGMEKKQIKKNNATN